MTRIDVVDASAMVAVAFAETDAESVVRRLADSHLLAPTFMRYEVANAMCTKARREPENRASLVALFVDFLGAAIESCDVDLVAASNLGLDHGLTVYDASYIWLARQRNAGLVTLDRQMARVASRIGIR